MTEFDLEEIDFDFEGFEPGRKNIKELEKKVEPKKETKVQLLECPHCAQCFEKRHARVVD